MQCYQQLSAANHSEYVGCILLASNLIISILAYLFYLSQGGKVVVWCFCSLRAASSHLSVSLSDQILHIVHRDFTPHY